MLKKYLNNICKVIIVSALSAGIIFLTGAFSLTVPAGVKVNGISVGGMQYREAAALIRSDTVRNLKTKKLIIRGAKNSYEYGYPEINFKDNLFKVLKSATRGQKLECEFSYYLCGMDEVVRGICEAERVDMVEPYAVFRSVGEPFIYYSGSDGSEADASVLYADIRSSLKGGFEEININYVPVQRTKRDVQVKRETQKLSEFTTYFDGDNLNRSSNIRLAAAKINGTVLNGGETLSFNERVGARTKSRGFLSAKIISDGEFKEGVGGGVCQVSTTLYNCALLSGLSVEEYHPHSLAVSYVPPSRDAMVSGSACDLKIKNVSKKPVYIRAQTGKNRVTFSIYGLSSGESFSLSSEVTGTLPATTEVCDSPEKARSGKDGLTSRSYLTVTRDGVKKKVLLRKDKYLPVKGYTFPDNENNGDT